MAVNSKAIIESVLALAAETTQYTAPAGARTIIDKFTATNTTAGILTMTIKLVPSGGAVGASNTIVQTQALAAGQCYAFPEVVGHTLNAGDFISTLPSGVGIAIRSSGREIT